jgi:NAD(P)-dependent dehydrogenase (short-subunit alcohol dehydrogenase family)
MEDLRARLHRHGRGASGHAIAAACARAGMWLALMDVQGERLMQVADELAAAGSDCLPLQVDLSDAADTGRAIERALAHYGTPRVLVHNAAILINRPLLDVSFEAWQREINVGIQAAFLLTQAVWSPMTAAGRGSIVYVRRCRASRVPERERLLHYQARSGRFHEVHGTGRSTAQYRGEYYHARHVYTHTDVREELC